KVDSNGRPIVSRPELQLECVQGCQRLSYCRADQRFGGSLFPGPPPQEAWDAILYYYCSKCRNPVKSFAIRILGQDTTLRAVAFVDAAKLGEWPPFSFRTPSKVTSLIGPDRELFLKGRKAESEG